MQINDCGMRLCVLGDPDFKYTIVTPTALISAILKDGVL